MKKKKGQPKRKGTKSKKINQIAAEPVLTDTIDHSDTITEEPISLADETSAPETDLTETGMAESNLAATDLTESDSPKGKGKRKKSKRAKSVKKSHSALMIAMVATVAIAAIIVGGTLLFQKIYYNNRWYKSTYINDVDVSGQTLAESKKTVLSRMDGYGLTVNGRNDGKLTISGDDIDYKFKINKKFDELFKKAHQSLPFFSRKKELTVNYDVSYDEEKLNNLIKQADIVAGSDDYEIVKPKSAFVAYSAEKLQYECVKEVMGNTIIWTALISGVKDALSKAETTLDIDDTAEEPSEHVLKDVYKMPRVTSDNPKLQEQMNICNNAALRFICWNMGKGVTEQITPKELSSWIRYGKGKIKYDWDAVSDWVEAFCKKYKTVGINRKVKMHNGKTVTVKGGDYGWQLDFEKTLKQAKKAIQRHIDQDLVNAYIENPSEENKAALTAKRKVQYLNTAFRKDYEDFMYDWDLKNYTEVSLSKQKVYVIRNGKVKFSCKTISGRPTPERATKKGAYFIKEHELSRVLVGEDYRTPVTNWVRITWTGTGFHSATWQPWSRWTKDLYKTRGSHGCLNLSLEDSQKIYKLTKYREAVFIY